MKLGCNLDSTLHALARPRSTRPRTFALCPRPISSSLADELRAETISAVSVTGGHLGAGLGVIELTVALHYVFDTPRDRMIWDVGHQAYPHKILTGRRVAHPLAAPGRRPLRLHQALRERVRPLRRRPIPRPRSPPALGMAVARDLDGRDNNVIAVIGDGAMSAGMAYEAMNNAGAMQLAPDRHSQRQRHVDRPAGRRAVGLSRPPRLQPHLADAARPRQAARQAPAGLHVQGRQAGRGIWPRHRRRRRHAVRGTRLLLRRPDRRPQPRPSAADPEERQGAPRAPCWSMS